MRVHLDDDVAATRTTGGFVHYATPPNPYREQAKNVSLADALEGVGHHDARCKGLDGEALDALLRGRMEEGRRMGQTDGRRAAESRFPEIWDEGWRTGREAGYEAGRSEVIVAITSALGPIQDELQGVKAKTRSAAMRKHCEKALDAIADLLWRP